MTLSAQTVNRMIASWRQARLTAGEHVLGYPATNILHPTHGVGVAVRVEEVGRTDAQKVQDVVDTMHDGMRAAFEAKHLGIIRGENARMLPQRARALILGLSYSTYKRRCETGWRYVQKSISA